MPKPHRSSQRRKLERDPTRGPATMNGPAHASVPDRELSPGQDQPVQIILDGNPVTSPTRRANGLQIRELGPSDRVKGFETQEVNCETGKKIKTIRDDETVELRKDECFRTVPNEGGPGGG
jgi:hypothetical protein